MDMERQRDEVYTRLRGLVLSGHYKPREQLKPRDIGKDLRVTPTPVREALMRLTGERVVVRSLGGRRGFYVPYGGLSELKDMYRWRQTLLMAALQAREGPIEARLEGEDYPGRVANVFAAIEARAVPELRLAGASADERLHLTRFTEPEILPHADEELAHIVEALAADGRAKAVHALRAYHERRVKAARAIRSGAVFRALGENGDER